MKAIVWSKDQCPYCVQAKALLESRGIEIFLDEEYVGGFTELRKKLT